MALTTRSTGTISPMQFESPLLTLSRPHPAPAMTPEGPLMLSIHPGMGSSQAAVTEILNKSKCRYRGTSGSTNGWSKDTNW